MKAIECMILDGPLSPGDLLALQVVENALREDLKPVEQAKAYRALMDRNGWSTHQLAAELAVSQNQVVTALQLLRLPEPVQARVERGEVAATTAYEISKVADPAEQERLAGEAAAGRLRRQDVRAARPKGRGVAKARKVTERVIRGEDGVRITVERRKGLDDATLIRALLAAIEQVRAGAAQAA